MKDLTLLIPAKQEAGSLPLVLDELKNYNCTKLIVLSKEDVETVEAIKKYECKIFYQKTNGYGSALIEGINEINTDYLCIFNADGSFDPINLNEMLEKCKRGNDFVFASRYSLGGGTKDDTFITFIGNKIF